MNFSICLIAKNEASVLPRCIKSLENFMKKGGEVCLLDTGSSDGTAKLARELGVAVWEVGPMFIRTIDEITAQKINKRFIINGEEKIIKGGDKLFDFAAARNFIADKASTNMIMCVDCDEVVTKMDIDEIEKLIGEGYQQFEYNFVYAHDSFGNPSIEFVQSKFYDKTLVRWSGIVHEVLSGPAKIKYIDKDVYLLEHFQVIGKEHRSNYLVGLSVDCIQNLNKDRQSHYFARELMYTGRFKSAIKEFERHISMQGWKLEAAQSMIYVGDCWGKLNQPDKQAEWYHRSFHFDSNRNEALLKLALFYKHNNNKLATLAYAKAALEIPLISYYANDMAYYTNLPHELLYWAYGWIGNVTKAQEHIQIALKYQPYNPVYLRDTQYYFEYPDSGIEGWMLFEECQALYNLGKKYNSICEVGSWKGRSTHAFLSGCKGKVMAVDTWRGSKDPLDHTYTLARESDIFEEFKKNVGHFKNLSIACGPSTEIAKTIPDKSFDIVFIDAGHTYEEVKDDIRAWKSKARIALCGHDYLEGTWMGVIQAVDEELGKPDERYGTVWVKYLKQEDVVEQIPKKIFTVWLSDKEGAPEIMQKCIKSQKISGYEHRIITLEDCRGLIETGEHEYLRECLESKRKNKWVKASDYLRVYYLYKEGGIYLDADVEILEGKNFDELLSNEMFAGEEANGFIGTAIIGARKGNPFLKTWLTQMTGYFKGDDDRNFECSVELLTKGYWEYGWYTKGFALLPKDYFYPYDHQADKLDITSKTITYHYFTKTWIKEELPSISIIIPTLGREGGLQNCLNSIYGLNYPQELIEIIVLKDEPRIGVPLRVKEGYEKSKGEYIVYAANDMMFTKDSLMTAIKDSIAYNKRLVVFEAGVRNAFGYTCEHFVIKRSLVEELGEIFDTRFKHFCVDDLLWKKAEKLNDAMISNARIIHSHYSRIGSGVPFDEINKLASDSYEEDTKLYMEELKKIENLEE